MFKILLFKLGFLQKYEIEYNGLFTGCKNQTIDFYYYKNCPQWFLKEAVLNYLKGRILTTFRDLVYIERINDWVIQKQMTY